MSTVPPAAPLLLALPLLLLLLLLLLLQPTAAKATAAKAAIAVVRLMMFLSLFEVVRLPWSAPTGPVRAYGPATARRWLVQRRRLRRRHRPGSRFQPGPRAGRTSPQAPRPAISLPSAGPASTLRPTPTAQALTTATVAAGRGGWAASLNRSGRSSTQSLPDSDLANTKRR